MTVNAAGDYFNPAVRHEISVTVDFDFGSKYDWREKNQSNSNC